MCVLAPPASWRWEQDPCRKATAGGGRSERARPAQPATPHLPGSNIAHRPPRYFDEAGKGEFGKRFLRAAGAPRADQRGGPE